MGEAPSATQAATAARPKGISAWLAGLTAFWSVVLPGLLHRYAPLLAAALADGAWTAAWRGVAAVLPLVAFVIGVLAPGHWPGIQSHVFTSSLSLVMVAIAGAILSGTFGVALLLGYSLSDILTNPYDPSLIANALWYGSFWGSIEVFGVHPFLILFHYGALVISYVLLGLLVVLIPQFARRMAEEVLERMPRRRSARLVVRAAVYAAGSGVLVYLWSQATVLLIRPLETSKGSPSIPPELFYVLQTQWLWLVVTAVVAAIARTFLEDHVSRSSPQVRSIMALRHLQWSRAKDRGTLWASLPLPVQIALVSIGSSLLLAGIATDTVQVLIAGLTIAAVQVLRYALSKPLLGLTRVPAALRFLVGFGAGLLLLDALMGSFLNPENGDSFLPILIGALLVMAIFGVLFPKARPMELNDGRRKT